MRDLADTSSKSPQKPKGNPRHASGGLGDFEQDGWLPALVIGDSPFPLLGHPSAFWALKNAPCRQ